MIEIKKYIDPSELPKESIKILEEVARKIASKSREVARLCSEALDDDGELSPEDTLRLLHIFRTELYKADLSVSEVHKHFEVEKKEPPSEQTEES